MTNEYLEGLSLKGLQDICITFKIKTYGSKKLLRDKIKKKIADRKEISNDNVSPAGAANIENKIGGKRKYATEDHVMKCTKKKNICCCNIGRK